MIGSEILDVSIGLILVYFLLSIVSSTILEVLDGILKMRAVNLERGIRELLHDPSGTGLAQDLFNHPMIYGLYRGTYDPNRIARTVKETGVQPGTDEPAEREIRYTRMPYRSELPSYIPSLNFAIALLDLAARGNSQVEPPDPSTEVNTEQLRGQVAQLDNLAVQRVLLSALDRANGDLEQAQANVEAWYNSSMDRVSGWYRRRTQGLLLGVGLLLAVLANADSIAIARHLYNDDEARQVAVAVAQRATTSARATDSTEVDRARVALDQLPLPLGWPDGFPPPAWKSWKAFHAWPDLLSPLLGWLMTALALSLGAPFWFDLLNKFMVIRSTVKPHEKSPEESSEDRQTGTERANAARTGTPGKGAADSPAAPAPAADDTPVAAPAPAADASGAKPAIPPAPAAGTATPAPAPSTGDGGDVAAPTAPVAPAAGATRIVKKICVDPGHGGHDPGGASLGTHENLLVLPYARQLRDELQARGHTVILTRDSDVFIPLEERARIANGKGADLFVSLHANASNDPHVKGPWTIHARGATVSQAVARVVQRALAGVMGGSPNAVYPDQSGWVSNRRLAVLRQTQMPAILLELGFMTNPVEIRRLEDAQTRSAICKAVADALDPVRISRER